MKLGIDFSSIVMHSFTTSSRKVNSKQEVDIPRVDSKIHECLVFVWIPQKKRHLHLRVLCSSLSPTAVRASYWILVNKLRSPSSSKLRRHCKPLLQRNLPNFAASDN